MSDTPMVEMMILEKRIAELEAELAEQRDLNKKFRMLPDARIAELERAYDVLAEEKLDKLVSYKKRIAELEAKNRHLHSLVKQLGDQVGETTLKNQRLRDALSSLSNEFDRMHTMVSSRYVAERLQALETESW